MPSSVLAAIVADGAGGVTALRAPFPYFGGKLPAVEMVWTRLGRPQQYIEPFCGSAAMLLNAPAPAALEVVNDLNGFIANFWRAVKHQPSRVAEWADYPVSHIDLGARHIWLMGERDRLGEALHDPDWPGDAKAAGWWLWGQCCWIGSGWAEWAGQIPHAGNAGKGVQARGQIPHAGDAGMGVQARGKIPHASDAGRDGLLTSSGHTAWVWLRQLSQRLERVRITHGSWDRCLNHHYGGEDTAVFLDPPYRAYAHLYGAEGVTGAVEAWAREHGHLRVALCGHAGDYALPGWEIVRWIRPGLTYGGDTTTANEAIWFSPACAAQTRQLGLAL